MSPRIVVILALLGALGTLGISASTASTAAEPYGFSEFGWKGTINYKYEQHYRFESADRRRSRDRETVIAVAVAVREDGDADYVGGWRETDTDRDLNFGTSLQCVKNTRTGTIDETLQAGVRVLGGGTYPYEVGVEIPKFKLETIERKYKEFNCSTLVSEGTPYVRPESVPRPGGARFRPKAPDVPKLVGVDMQKGSGGGGYYDEGDVTYTTKVNLVGCGEEAQARWVRRFPGDNRLSALKDPFQTNVRAFIAALRDAGATVKINAVYRPQPRAYLMHYAWRVAYGRGTGKYSKLEPDKVPPYNEGPEKVPICWTVRDDSRNAGSYVKSLSVGNALAMVRGYAIVVAHGAAYPTNHEKRTALDMNISWSGPLRIKPGTKAPFREDDSIVEIIGGPRTGMHPRLWPVGRSYGVIKYVNETIPDPPHWSANGS